MQLRRVSCLFRRSFAANAKAPRAYPTPSPAPFPAGPATPGAAPAAPEMLEEEAAMQVKDEHLNQMLLSGNFDAFIESEIDQDALPRDFADRDEPSERESSSQQQGKLLNPAMTGGKYNIVRPTVLERGKLTALQVITLFSHHRTDGDTWTSEHLASELSVPARDMATLLDQYRAPLVIDTADGAFGLWEIDPELRDLFAAPAQVMSDYIIRKAGPDRMIREEQETVAYEMQSARSRASFDASVERDASEPDANAEAALSGSAFDAPPAAKR